MFNPNQPHGFPPQGAPAPFQGQGAQQQEAVPLSQTPADMQMLDIDLGYDASADANALLPPVLPTEYLFGNTTDSYQCTVEFAETDPAKRFLKKKTDGKRGAAREYIYVELMLVIQNCVKNPAMNGRRIPYRASTLTSEGMKTNAMQALIQATPLSPQLLTMPRTAATLMGLTVQIVNTKTVLQCFNDWEASFYDKEAGKDLIPRVRGWRNFLNPQTQQLNEELVVNIPTAQGPRQESRRPRSVPRFVTYGTQAPRASVNMAAFQATSVQPQQQQQQQLQQQPVANPLSTMNMGPTTVNTSQQPQQQQQELPVATAGGSIVPQPAPFQAQGVPQPAPFQAQGVQGQGTHTMPGIQGQGTPDLSALFGK